jgi:hypothetical protein
MTGGDGNDVLVGTDGSDSLSGGPGNDSVSGARGNDDVAGDEGDDILIWNPGEGSDKLEGGPGNDVAQDNGGAAAEHFIVSANGQRVTATRDNGAPFFLDVGTAETLDLNAGAGDDSVEVNDGLAALIKVDADLGDGNDSVEARNDSAQVIDGGAGTDRADVDATDQVRNVEAVTGAAPGVDRVAPKVRVLAARKLAVKGGKARVRITCPAGETACNGDRETILARLRTARAAGGAGPGEDRPVADAAALRTVALTGVTEESYERLGDDALALRFHIGEPAAAGAILRQLGSPPSWALRSSPADLLGPAVAAAAALARELALGTPADPAAPEDGPTDSARARAERRPRRPAR